MRKDAIELEEDRLKDINNIDDYDMVHERHRIFPEIFGNKNHKTIIDLSAGIGIVASRIQKFYSGELICNEISPKCLKVLNELGLKTVSFDIDNSEQSFPFPDKHFDAVISLATIEHLFNTEHFLKEVYRILNDNGCFYLSAPNYSALTYLVPLILNGKTFHDPMKKESEYEFYAHIRYFTLYTLIDLAEHHGFKAETVYLAMPKESTYYQKLKERSKYKAFIMRNAAKILYQIGSPRWASEPIICLTKNSYKKSKYNKIIL